MKLDFYCKIVIVRIVIGQILQYSTRPQELNTLVWDAYSGLIPSTHVSL